MDYETAMNMIRAGQMLPAKQTINLASENLKMVSDSKSRDSPVVSEKSRDSPVRSSLVFAASVEPASFFVSQLTVVNEYYLCIVLVCLTQRGTFLNFPPEADGGECFRRQFCPFQSRGCDERQCHPENGSRRDFSNSLFADWLVTPLLPRINRVCWLVYSSLEQA